MTNTIPCIDCIKRLVCKIVFISYTDLSSDYKKYSCTQLNKYLEEENINLNIVKYMYLEMLLDESKTMKSLCKGCSRLNFNVYHQKKIYYCRHHQSIAWAISMWGASRENSKVVEKIQSHITIDTINTCPCRECLVKGICEDKTNIKVLSTPPGENLWFDEKIKLETKCEFLYNHMKSYGITKIPIEHSLET